MLVASTITSLPRLKINLCNSSDHFDWWGINGFSNILVHGYLRDIDSETVKKVISDYLPELEKMANEVYINQII
jgi:uncharacterized protein with HEPN domain